MTVIKLITKIKAPVQHVFDLSRDIDFHMKSASQTSEKAIAGVTTGLINSGESVTWKGKHFGLWLTHTSTITHFHSPYSFTDEMTKGYFKSFKHQHIFNSTDRYVEMIDHLNYKVPGGIIGSMFDNYFLKNYFTAFLKHRNYELKKALEL